MLESALLDVGKCVGESELNEIRGELTAHGLPPRHHEPPSSSKQLPPSKPYHYRSSDGIDIYVGKNSLQNDRLTGSARGGEMWLHAKDMPGSHVIIRTEDAVPETTLSKPPSWRRGTARASAPAACPWTIPCASS